MTTNSASASKHMILYISHGCVSAVEPRPATCQSHLHSSDGLLNVLVGAIPLHKFHAYIIRFK